MTPDYKKPNEEMINVYKDTLLQASQLPFGKTKKYYFQSSFDSFDDDEHPIKNGSIQVWNMDSVTAMKLLTSGRTAILNMASYKRPGGGVARGSKAQEEALFRCSNLAFSISKELYPLKENEALYTTEVTFFKDFYYQNMEPVMCDVLTIAAINLFEREDFRNSKEYFELTYNKIRLMLKIAKFQKVDNLVLSAWGCGVFKNDPKIIAQAFKDCLIENSFYKNFNQVVFAIINDHNSVSNNYTTFKEIFS